VKSQLSSGTFWGRRNVSGSQELRTPALVRVKTVTGRCGQGPFRERGPGEQSKQQKNERSRRHQSNEGEKATGGDESESPRGKGKFPSNKEPQGGGKNLLGITSRGGAIGGQAQVLRKHPFLFIRRKEKMAIKGISAPGALPERTSSTAQGPRGLRKTILWEPAEPVGKARRGGPGSVR